MASHQPGALAFSSEKHTEAERQWREERLLVCDRCAGPLGWDPLNFEAPERIERNKSNPNVWYVCEPCHFALEDVSILFKDDEVFEISGSSDLPELSM